MARKKHHSRTYPRVRVRRASPNRSSRGGARQTLFVVHATAGHNRPGVSDLTGLGGWFAQRSSEVSSHSASDNEGNSAVFVPMGSKAWHCAAYNRMSYGHEQVIPGNGREVTTALVKETARWIAWWSIHTGVPIRKARVRSGRVLRTGVIRHSELGALGGGHADPGKYPLARCLIYARFYRSRMKAGRH